MSHIVGIYINHNSKEFSLTARTENHAHLPIMEEDMKARGFFFIIMAKDLDKPSCEALKTRLWGDMELAGYKYTPRGPIF